MLKFLSWNIANTLHCKIYLHFYSKKYIDIFENTLATTINEFVINELVKLTMLWTTGHYFATCCSIKLWSLAIHIVTSENSEQTMRMISLRQIRMLNCVFSGLMSNVQTCSKIHVLSLQLWFVLGHSVLYKIACAPSDHSSLIIVFAEHSVVKDPMGPQANSEDSDQPNLSLRWAHIEGWAQDYGNSNIFLKPLFRGNLDPFVNNANLGAIAHTSNGT